jgi:hypothetical protein
MLLANGETCMRFASVLDKVSNEMIDKMHNANSVVMFEWLIVAEKNAVGIAMQGVERER